MWKIWGGLDLKLGSGEFRQKKGPDNQTSYILIAKFKKHNCIGFGRAHRAIAQQACPPLGKIITLSAHVGKIYVNIININSFKIANL